MSVDAAIIQYSGIMTSWNAGKDLSIQKSSAATMSANSHAAISGANRRLKNVRRAAGVGEDGCVMR